MELFIVLYVVVMVALTVQIVTDGDFNSKEYKLIAFVIFLWPIAFSALAVTEVMRKLKKDL